MIFSKASKSTKNHDVSNLNDFANCNTVNGSILFHSIFANYELSLALIGIIAFSLSIQIALVMIMPILIFFVFIILTTTDRLDGSEIRALDKKFKSNGLTIFRKSRVGVCFVYSVPFASIVFLTKYYISSPDSIESRAVIQHELGHNRQFDWPIIWALWFINFPSFLFMIFLIDAQIGWIVPLKEVRVSGLDTSYVTAWVVVLFTLSLVLTFGIKYCIHRREFRADLFALQRDAEAYTFFLSQRLEQERKLSEFPDATPYYEKFKIRYFHPSWEARVYALRHGFKPSNWFVFLSSSYWAAFAAIIVQVALRVNINRNYMFGNQHNYQPHLAVAASILLIIAVQRNLIKISSAEYNDKRPIFILVLLGTYFGILSASIFGQYIEYTNFTITSLSLPQYILVSALAITSWMVTFLLVLVLFRWHGNYFIAHALGVLSAGFALGASSNQIRYSSELSIYEFSQIPLLILIIYGLIIGITLFLSLIKHIR